jgi:hypothetical protein
MTPSMAAMVPGGCVLVANSECEAAAAPVTNTGTTGQIQSPWGQVAQPALNMFEGPIEINVKVLEPKRHRPLPGAKVTISLMDRRTGAITNSNVASGTTDGNGKYVVEDMPPSPNNMYTYKIKVSPGEGQDFPYVTGELPARSPTSTAAGTRGLDRQFITLSVCLAGTDPLVCEVAKMQVNLFLTVAGQGPQNSRLGSNWGHYQPWMQNMEVLPEEWPELVTNVEQMVKVWNEVPWPRTAELKDLFIRCARGMVLHDGMRYVDQNLYLNRYSNFWPKTDEELRRLIATVSLQSIPTIYACMQHKIEKKIRDQERSAKTWQIIGLAAGMLFTGNLVASVIFSAATQLSQFNNAMEFSKFMMGYAEFVEACMTAEQEDFTCTYLAPFVLWAMETLYMGEFFDWVAMESGLPGARPGLTQEEVIEPMVEIMKDNGVDVPKAAYTPGGVAKGPNPLLIAAGGVGVVGLVALIASGVLKK